MIREYECIEPFSVCYYDTETDSYDESQSYDVEKGSIWEREEDDNDFSYSCTGADIHLEGDNGWLEINEEDLERCFKLIESEEK